jgi:hypothetical protein
MNPHLLRPQPTPLDDKKNRREIINLNIPQNASTITSCVETIIAGHFLCYIGLCQTLFTGF